jgi:hypothetical protein
MPGGYPFALSIPNVEALDPAPATGYTRLRSNGRLLFLLKAGMTGLNIDYDVPTRWRSTDHASRGRCRWHVGGGAGGCGGVGRRSLEKVSSTLICQPPASSFIVASYVLMAEARLPKEDLIGTIMVAASRAVGLPRVEHDLLPDQFTYRIGSA